MSAAVRVVVVEYDGEATLPRCLTSLARTTPPSAKLSVLDNASPVPADSLIPDELRDRIDIVRLDENVGYAGAIAQAWSMGDEQYLVVANNDLEFTAGWLEALVETAERTGAHAVSAVIRHEGASDLELTTNASLNPLLYLIPGVFTDRTRAVYPSGACFLLRRDPGMPTGKSAPVDPFYFLYYEDVYLGFLLRSLGKVVIQCPDAHVRHVGSHSVRRLSPNRIAFLQERNRLITTLLFFDLATLLGLSPLIFLDSLFRIPACLLRRKPILATLWPHIWVPLHLRSIMRKRAKLRGLPDFDSRRILPYLTGKVLSPTAPGAAFINAISTAWFRLVGIPVDREARE